MNFYERGYLPHQINYGNEVLPPLFLRDTTLEVHIRNQIRERNEFKVAFIDAYSTEQLFAGLEILIERIHGVLCKLSATQTIHGRR